MRRRGLPSSEKLPRVGKATLLHQHSSRKPTAQVSGLAAATSISRSRRLFSFIQGVGGGDPAFGPLPSHSEKTRQGGPDGLARDPSLCKPLLKARLCRHLQSPQARVVSELPRGAVEHLPQEFGALLVEGVPGPSGARGSGNESIHAPLVEIMDGVAHRLRPAAEARGDSRGILAPRARQRSAWHRRMVKVSFERSQAWRASRSSSENERTKMGVFMDLTVTRNTKPILKMH